LGGPSHRPVPYQKPRWVGDGGCRIAYILFCGIASIWLRLPL
jgi:hypothetical protein